MKLPRNAIPSLMAAPDESDSDLIAPWLLDFISVLLYDNTMNYDPTG